MVFWVPQMITGNQRHSHTILLSLPHKQSFGREIERLGKKAKDFNGFKKSFYTGIVISLTSNKAV